MNFSMVMWWVMFREVIPHVLTSWFPIKKDVFLFYPVLHPIESHVHCLVTFLSNRSGEDAFGRGVICFDWGWWLGKTEFVECDVEGYRFPHIETFP